MTPIQRIALVYGLVFALVGGLGFLSTGFGMQMSLLLGLFPVNLVHNAVHVAFGVLGFKGSKSVNGAIAYCRGAGIACVVLAVLGIVAGNVLMPFLPVHGNDVWLHALLGFTLLGLGFGMSPEPADA